RAWPRIGCWQPCRGRKLQPCRSCLSNAASTWFATSASMRTLQHLRPLVREEMDDMSTVDTFAKSYEFYRKRTLDLLEKIAAELDPAAGLGWRPGRGRAHIAWQLMHIGITEEIFATERLAPDKPAAFTELWPRFRGGST